MACTRLHGRGGPFVDEALQGNGRGTGDLAGFAGTGPMVAPGGRTGTYELEYELPG